MNKRHSLGALTCRGQHSQDTLGWDWNRKVRCSPSSHMVASSAIPASLSVSAVLSCFSQQTGFFSFFWLPYTLIILAHVWFWLPQSWFLPDSTWLVHTCSLCLSSTILPLLLTEELTVHQVPGLACDPGLAIDSLSWEFDAFLGIFYHFCHYSVYLFAASWFLFAQSSCLFMVSAYPWSRDTAYSPCLSASVLTNDDDDGFFSPILIPERKKKHWKS